MDDPTLDPALHRQALRGLARINAISRSAAMLWPYLRAEARRRPGQPLHVIDLACGGGDTLIDHAQRAQRAGLKLRLTGLDMSETALEHARQRVAEAGVPDQVDFVQLDLFAADQPPLPPADVAMNSLFMHHLTQAQAVTLLRQMGRTAARVLINDLRRGRTAYAVTVAGTRLLSRSPVVHIDGPRSVRAAWTPDELRALAEEAGLRDIRVSRRFPFRMVLDARGEAGADA
jgi:2-polyprenyl-3-methyl-5-hydroxy-6-metoxy-1,4-benzoquinol methylase